MSEEVLPLRVLDIKETLQRSGSGGLCFRKPYDWDFHVISHTWSLGVRQLSVKIGEHLMRSTNMRQQQQQQQDLARAYNEAFEGADLRGEDCYGELVELFRLLDADGVERVWFDALTINQSDGEEKSREISFMGAYYANSRGCYVLLHGVGQGYAAWSSEIGLSQDDLWNGEPAVEMVEEFPRWFSRVWTLQEFLLPRHLWFLVEGLSLWALFLINYRIATCSPACVGLCKCCLLPLDTYRSSFLKAAHFLSQLWTASPASRFGGPIDRVLETSRFCPTCGSAPLIRRIAGTEVYLVEKEAYMLVVSVERWAPAAASACGDLESRLWAPHTSSGEAYEALLNLYNMQREAMYAWRVIGAIAQRKCSVEEDRLLGVLSLLGVEGMVQVRAGKLLQEQIVAFAQVCDGERLIRSLLAVDYVGNRLLQGMSWAPNFQTSSQNRLEEMGDAPISSYLTLLHVNLEGLTLSSTFEALPLYFSDQSHVSNKQDHQGTFTYEKPFSYPCHVFLDPSTQVPIPHVLAQEAVRTNWALNIAINSTWWEESEGEKVGALQLLLSLDFPHPYVMFFSLVAIVLGHTLDTQGRKRLLTMLCIENTQHVLHKVGILSFPFELGSTLFKQFPSTFCIGGFGSDLSAYVKVTPPMEKDSLTDK